MRSVTYREPSWDWQTFGRAERMPTKDTIPEVGDDLEINFGDENFSTRVGKVIHRPGRESIVKAALAPGVVLTVKFGELRIGYDRMGHYRWENNS